MIEYPGPRLEWEDHVIPTSEMLRPEPEDGDDSEPRGPWVCVRAQFSGGVDGWIYGELVGAENGWLSVYIREREQVHNVNINHVYQWVDTEPGQWTLREEEEEAPLDSFPFRPK